MKKWDERYFVLTTQRLYYFKTMEVRAAPLWRCLVSPMPYPRCASVPRQRLLVLAEVCRSHVRLSDHG